jgi:hypothetical protein
MHCGILTRPPLGLTQNLSKLWNSLHLVDGKSDWLISIMKDFDWLQVYINNSFKNSSVKATINNIKVKRT